MSWPRDASTRVTTKSRIPKFDPYRLPHERSAARLTLDDAISGGRLDDFIAQCEADGVRAAKAEEARVERKRRALARIEAGTAGTVKQGPVRRAKAGSSSKGQSHA